MILIRFSPYNLFQEFSVIDSTLLLPVVNLTPLNAGAAGILYDIAPLVGHVSPVG